MNELAVLMYHKVSERPAASRHPTNFVSEALFRTQIDALLSWGHTPIDFETWRRYRAREIPLPHRPFIVTFDDGYTCFDTAAWPVLADRKVPATVFLVAGELGGSNSWDKDEPELPLMSVERIRALHAAGVTFGAHGVQHLPLARVSPAEARDELVNSRAILQDQIGAPVSLFAYPYSNQSAAVRQMARDAGYAFAVRGKGRMNRRETDPHGLRRILMDDTMTVDRLRSTLTRLRWIP